MLVQYTNCISHDWDIVEEITEGKHAGKFRKVCKKCARESFINPTKEAPRYARYFGSDFYSTEEWLRARFRVLANSVRICALCGSDEKPLHVDHIKPRSKYPHLALDPSNLQILCWRCNKGKCNTDEQDFR